jgi:hypothetical protein
MRHVFASGEVFAVTSFAVAADGAVYVCVCVCVCVCV